MYPFAKSHTILQENCKTHLDQLLPEGMEEVMTGTTIMAVEFNGGVVLGADSRTSMGAFCSSRLTDKLTKVTDNIYCCRSGSAADTQAIAEIVSSHMDILEIKLGEPPLVRVAANAFKNICYNYRDQLSAGIIVAGFDKRNGGQVYQIPLGGMITRMPIAVGGSGSTFVIGHIDASFKVGMTKAECVAFVKKAVTLALTRDNSSSGLVRIAVITKDGVERETHKHCDLDDYYQG